MSGSRPLLVALALVALLAGGCRTPAVAPLGDPLDRQVRFAPIVPDELDHAVADLVGAALAMDEAETARALGRFELAELRHARKGEPSGLVPAAIELGNAVLYPGRELRDAIRALLERDDLEEPMRARLERELDDDPLELASARVHDAWVVDIARLFNAVSEPVGRSVLSTTLAPYNLGRSLAYYALDLAKEDALPLRRRQALVHWKTFSTRFPDEEATAELASRIASAQARWHETQRDRAVDRAERALDARRSRPALLYARRALRHRPVDERAAEIVALAEADLAREREARRATDGFVWPPRDPVVSRETRIRTVALLGPAPLTADLEADLRNASPEERFAHAIALGESGRDAVMWESLAALEEDESFPMDRHAEALRLDPIQNPYDAFREARRSERWRTAIWVLLGPLAAAPDRGATGAFEWLLDLPGRVQIATLLPFRLLELTWRNPVRSARQTAVHARRYLAREPRGEYAPEVGDWLDEYERKRDNWIGVLRLAERRGDRDDPELDALRERAAEQALGVAVAEERRDMRSALLLNVARSFPETGPGRRAGVLAGEQVREATPHRIQLSRGFLEENPEVAGADGLALSKALLDDDPRNGELHPEGVALVGGRDLEVSLLAESGDEDDPPERLRTTVSEARLARLVSRIEETSFRNALVDPEDALEADPQRDVVFERARLGLAEQIDTRPTAEARFAYRGMRERYGMVRSRKTLLPFDIVVQGSLSDLSLGAFPRMRMPDETGDALLYR